MDKITMKCGTALSISELDTSKISYIPCCAFFRQTQACRQGGLWAEVVRFYDIWYDRRSVDVWSVRSFARQPQMGS